MRKELADSRTRGWRNSTVASFGYGVDGKCWAKAFIQRAGIVFSGAASLRKGLAALVEDEEPRTLQPNAKLAFTCSGNWN
ncbi:MAG: hypothetical protein OXN84_18335, partial [Albidovulum sp.]|nr:hypothetical protein [Albidovulum sp.]